MTSSQDDSTPSGNSFLAHQIMAVASTSRFNHNASKEAKECARVRQSTSGVWRDNGVFIIILWRNWLCQLISGSAGMVETITESSHSAWWGTKISAMVNIRSHRRQSSLWKLQQAILCIITDCITVIFPGYFWLHFDDRNLLSWLRSLKRLSDVVVVAEV